MSTSQDETPPLPQENRSMSQKQQYDLIESIHSSEHSELPPPKPARRNLPSLKPIKPQRLKKPHIDVTSEDISELTNSEYASEYGRTHSDYAPTTSKSDIRSYREKLKDRFLLKKKQMEKTLKKQKIKTFRSHANNIITLNRSIDIMKKENSKVEAQMRVYKRTSSIESVDGVVTKAERYQFFCESVRTDYLHELFDSLDKIDGFDEFSDLDEEDRDLVPVVYRRASYVKEEIHQAEAEMIWTPNSKPLSIEEKINGDPRSLEEEGFYVPEKLKMRRKHLNILEHRLLINDDIKWFDSRGELNTFESPYKNLTFRPEDFARPTKLEIEYKKPTVSVDELETIYISKDDILDVNIHSVKFKHHPLFSAEHVLQEKLISFYDTHREYIVSNKIERLYKKLTGLRKTVANLLENFQSSGDGIRMRSSLQIYYDQIKKFRKELFHENKMYRFNTAQVLYTWKYLKKLREENGYSNTSVRLEIRKEKCDAEKEQRELDTLFEETLQEVISESESDFNRKLKEYKKALNEWRKLSNTSDDDEIEKPQKPQNLDFDKIAKKLRNEFNNSFKTPGEPNLFFTLKYDNEITKTTNHQMEELRRKAVNSTKVHLKISCNNIEVCKSKTKLLTDYFTCHFEESFALKFMEPPETLLIEVHEQNSGLLKRKLCGIKITIPTKKQKKVFEEHFTKNDLIHYKHTGIGSGEAITNLFKEIDEELFENEPQRLHTTGFLTCNIGFDTKDFGNVDSEQQSLNIDILDKNGFIDAQKLKEWVEVAQPDPMDPKNAVIFEYLNEAMQENVAGGGKSSYFRCDPYLYPMELCSREELEDNVRFKLLGLRDQNVPEFVGMVVPNRLKEIPSNIFSSYERRLAEENHEEYLKDDDYEYEINLQRSYGRKYIRQVHTKIFQLCRNSDNNLAPEDIVNEKMVPFIETYIKTLLSNFFNWFKLKPNISKPLPIRHSDETNTNYLHSNLPRIKIFIKSGVNVPTRKEMCKQSSSRRSKRCKGDDGAMDVRPFVEVTYQTFSSTSSSSLGKNPTWNEDVEFPLEIINADYLSPQALHGWLAFNLFDDLGEGNDVMWLGSVLVPISAVAEDKKLEGCFLVRTPAMLFGYEQEQEFHTDVKSRLNKAQQSYANYTYLNMSITIEPNVPKLSPDMASLGSCETPYVLNHILLWNEKFNADYSKRKFFALAIDSNGKTVCATRFIKALEPPQINADGFDVTPDQCARYVSLIPFTDSNKFYQNIWLSTEQMLKLGIGSIIDHAIALTCYFLTLNLEAWLLLGFGIPHGSTAYVLIRDYATENEDPIHYVYDVTTGLKYNTLDPFCPLQRIYCVINGSNIWGNVQRSNDVSSTKFEFTRRFDWYPVFNQQVTVPTNTYQQKLSYVMTYDLQKVQSSIEKKLKKKIAKLRSHERTIWNHYMCNILKNAMGKFEVNMMHGKTHLELPEVIEMAKGFKITGCLMHFPFESVSITVERITNIRLHQEIEDTTRDNVEFALGVHVHPYPNQVVALWIAFLRLIKKT